HIVNRATMTATGTYQFVAANGDTLTASFSGKATPTATRGVLSIVEAATITGGTGRFAGATGGFTCVRWFNTVAGTTAASFNGTTSAPGPGNERGRQSLNRQASSSLGIVDLSLREKGSPRAARGLRSRP